MEVNFQIYLDGAEDCAKKEEKMELPETFRQRMMQLLGGQEFAQYEQSFNSKRVYGLRVNTRKISTQEFEKISPFEINKIPWIENGYYYNGEKESPAKHPYYHAGLYYLQEPSAMTPASLLPVKEGDYVLDLCAAPGGKATELASKLNGTGFLVANDISNSRAKGLLKNLELFGIQNMLVANESPERLLQEFPAFFDKILIDAPCSGEGMFRKEPAIIKSWEKKGPSEFAKIQRGIVRTAVQMLKPGGLLLYSTCTFSPEEDEGTVSYLLDVCKDLEIEPLPWHEGFSKGRPDWLSDDDTKYESLERCVRIFPHKMKGEGHFICLLRKKGAREENIRINHNAEPVNNTDFLEFMKLLDMQMQHSRLKEQANRIYYLPVGCPDRSGLRFLRNGLLLGECKKNRFEPSQALAMALEAGQCRQKIQFSPEDERVIKYLKGETLEVSDCVKKDADGWHLICVDKYPLGWGKVKKGNLKNKYHAGWRWR